MSGEGKPCERCGGRGLEPIPGLGTLEGNEFNRLCLECNGTGVVRLLPAETPKA